MLATVSAVHWLPVKARRTACRCAASPRGAGRTVPEPEREGEDALAPRLLVMFHRIANRTQARIMS